MTDKPSYEDLENRVKELEKEAGNRKKADGALYQSKEKYQNILSSIEEGYYEVDLAGNLTFFNDSLCKIYGYSRDELMGMNNRDYMTAETAKKTYEIFNRVYRTGEPTKIFDWKFIKKDDSTVDVEISVSLIRDQKGKATGFRGIVRDITKRKWIEKNLQENKAMFQAIVESLPFDIFALDQNNRYFFQNSICKKNWGNLLGKLPEDISVNDETKSVWLENNRRAFSGETVTGEVIYNRLNGDKSYYYNIISPIRDKEKIFGILGVLIDITEIKRVEEALRKSREQFRNLTETTSDWVWEIDKNSFYTYVSPKIRDILGYYPEEIIGKTPFDLMHPKEADRVFNIFNTIRDSQQPFHCLENINLHKNGHPVILETSGIPVFNTDGEFCGYRGVDREITERKKTEKALMESKESYRRLLETMSDGFGIQDKKGTITYANNKFAQMLGYKPENLIGKSVTDLLDDRNKKILKKQISKRKKGEVSPYEIEWNSKDGKNIPTIMSPQAIFDEKGQFKGSFSVITDISMLKQVEEELRKTHDELENRVAERTRELEVQKSNLEETNIALQVLLEKRQEDKKEVEDNVLTNVKEMIAPYFEKFRKTKLDDQQKAVLNIVESNLNEIISPFSRKMSLKYLNLTPTEIHVANLIRYGSDSKEIADIMSLSPRTIYNHRKNIRKKFGLENKKTNLRSHLLSIY